MKIINNIIMIFDRTPARLITLASAMLIFFFGIVATYIIKSIVSILFDNTYMNKWMKENFDTVAIIIMTSICGIILIYFLKSFFRKG